MMDELHRGAAGKAQWLNVSWDDKDIDWTGFDAAIIGTTWDYWDRLSEYLTTLNRIANLTRLYNPPEIIRWNIHKSYLVDLERHGANIIPTLWFESVTQEAVNDAFDKLCTNDIVLKRQVGAGADGQHRLKRGDPIPAMPHPMMIQPFMQNIQTEGELSFVFIDGAFSHALLKCSAEGDYRIQSTYGGTDHPIQPDPVDLAAAQALMQFIDTPDGLPPLYARVDMLRGEDGRLLLMELEMIEPFLYPLEGPGLGARLTDALLNRVRV